MRTDTGNTSPLREVWTIAWPTILTMTSYTVMQTIDKLMVARIGPLEVAAQGNGGIWAFTPMAFAFGTLMIVNTYVSQNLGAGHPERGPRYAWAAAWLSVVVWLVVLVPYAFALPWLFSYMHDPETVREIDRLIELESGYGRILLFGAVVVMIGKGVNNYFFGMHMPKIVTVSAVAGIVVNILANYVLIFGERGLPELGLPGVPGVPALGLFGAAYGTVIGTVVEVAIPAAIFLGPKLNAAYATRAAWRPRLGPMVDLLKIGWAPSIQFGNEIVCWSIFMTVLVGVFGEDHMTAGWAALGWMHLSFMPAVGCSVAVTSLVGRYIGEGRPEVAIARARLGLLMAMSYMTLCAAAFFIFREPMIAVFVASDVTPERAETIISIGAKLMICAAVFQTFDSFGIVYTGALRGAGDTTWPGAITVLYAWGFIIGAGWLFIFIWPGLESIGPWIGASIYIILLGVTMAWRFEAGKWRSINLLEPEPSPGTPAQDASPGEAPRSTRAGSDTRPAPGT